MAKQAMPDLRNATVQYLVDETKSIRDEFNRLKELEAYYSTALKARMEGTKAEGEKYVATLTTETQERISAEKCREVLDADTLAKVMATLTMKKLLFSPKPVPVDPKAP